MAENNKARLQAQGPKDPTRKQPITIVEDAFEEQTGAPKKKKKVQPNSLFQECEGIGNNSKAVEKNPQSGNEAMFQPEKNSKTGNKKTVQDDTMDEDDASSNEEGEDTSGLSIESNKKGMSIDMYFKVHGINFEDEEDEEDEEHEEDAANIEGSGGQASNEVRNPRFVTLLYTSWHGVPDNIKEGMWEYANQKFILPISSKPWVMRGFCRAWKKYKGEIKKEHFLKYNTKKEMIKNRPLEIPEFQFRKLIRYWSLPAIKAMSVKNTENRSKQTCPHRMGSTNFAIVRKQLRDSKENNEEPSRAEVFTATRTSKNGKEIDAKTQTTINELQSRIEAGENHEDAFVAVLGKDQPGRLRCYGTSITKSSLRKDEEIRQVKVEYNDKVHSLEKKMDGVCGLLKVMLHQLNPGMSEEEVAALVQAAQNSPLDASSSRPRNTPHSSEATHIPPSDNLN
ncbi:uncharacterized protein LOC130976480 [Arachis stenosperma]|uniref:uncharacterized protein LOC130976480 n=1 Tax=Arachis stenosperma TaxID=217475 RepID=UPI0025ABBD9E|nr:uncharacterized protein LOC130976480 [Arachis stenosperma]